MGLTCYPSVLNVEEPIDLAVIVVPAQVVKESLTDCIKKKIKAAVIISSGFSEIGQKDLELELKMMCKDKIRLIGPNCLGIYKKNLDMLFLPRKRLKRPADGSISFITQSGAFGAALLDMVADEGVGISKFISIGNKIDVEEVELLKYLDRDLETRCIALYIETIENGLELIETARKIVKKKPIVVFKAGKTSKGAEAVASHTGKLATKPEVYSAVFKQAGMIEAQTTEELFDYAKSLADQPILNGNKIAIVTDGGGFGIVAADQAVLSGFELPELSKEALKVIKNALPAYGIAKNPVDLIGDSNSEIYEKVLGAVFKDPNINGVVVIALLQIPTLEETITDVLRDCKIHGKPFTVCSAGGQ
jgi:acyl-CoA synthetase (NDP forming)